MLNFLRNLIIVLLQATLQSVLMWFMTLNKSENVILSLKVAPPNSQIISTHAASISFFSSKNVQVCVEMFYRERDTRVGYATADTVVTVTVWRGVPLFPLITTICRRQGLGSSPSHSH